ncbi:MAG: hypothetical protein Q8N77_01175, partial [Nanoarchaeota archaeon]|nr:hypothetical protein [Nanoarchaeota archaeon]
LIVLIVGLLLISLLRRRAVFAKKFGHVLIGVLVTVPVISRLELVRTTVIVGLLLKSLQQRKAVLVNNSNAEMNTGLDGAAVMQVNHRVGQDTIRLVVTLKGVIFSGSDTNAYAEKIGRCVLQIRIVVAIQNYQVNRLVKMN